MVMLMYNSKSNEVWHSKIAKARADLIFVREVAVNPILPDPSDPPSRKSKRAGTKDQRGAEE